MNRIAGLRWCALSLVALLVTPLQGQTLVGRTDGEAGVSASGAARYTIPLRLPPGTNGLAPSLAITYDSRGGNGLLGVGFHLAGLSAIRRCGSTLAQDGTLAAVALTSSDRFCLDGHRLRLTAGTYGAAGSQYQAEVETFARVTAIGTVDTGPASFRVERSDGLIHEYGATNDSRVESAGSTTPREWALSRIRDRDGNYADVVHAEDPAAGTHRPLRIDYTGNLLTGAMPYYSIRFAYESRPANDQPAVYIAGGRASEPMRLDRIDVVHIATGRVVRSFDLTYAAPGATGRSRLASVQECAGTACFPPTQFSWTTAGAGWGPDLPVTLTPTQYAASIPGDVDGDGFDDLAYHDPATSRWTILRGGANGFQYPAVNTGLGGDSVPGQALGADLDGDGRRDILVPGSGNVWHWLRRTPSGSFAYGSTGVANVAPSGGMLVADIDGDGRDDLVYVKSAGDGIYWRRNLTTAAPNFAAEAALWLVPLASRLPASPFVQTSQTFRSIVHSGDFNGDGRADLLVLTQVSGCRPGANCGTWTNRWRALASTGTGLVTELIFDGNTEPLVADFNSDGIADIGYWSTGATWQLLFGAGSRGTNRASFAGPFASAAVPASSTGRASVVDWDADGRADILQSTEGGELSYCRSAGSTLEPCLPTGIAPGALSMPPKTLDVNGDGYADLLYSASAIRLHLHQPLPPDSLLAATDGLGARTTFEYAPSSSSDVHRAGTASTFPVRDLSRFGHLVARLTRAGAGGSQQEAYFYEGAKLHVQGRGFLGFARRTATPANANPVRVEEYAQDPAAFERIGAPLRITTQQPSGLPIVRTTYQWSRLALGSGSEARAFAYPSSVTTERFELDGVKISSTVATSTVDSFGTTVQRTARTTEHAKGLNPGAEHVETVALTGVVNDTTNWCLGRPASTQVSRWHSLSGGAQLSRVQAHAWDYARCRPTQLVVEPASATLRVTTDLAYDSYGNLRTVQVTPVGQETRTTTHAWIENGRFLRTSANPEGHVTTWSWDSELALQVGHTDPNGLVASLQYDELGRQRAVVRPDGTSNVIARSPCGTGCPMPGIAYVVTSTELGAGGAPGITAEAGFDMHGRQAYARNTKPDGSHVLRVRRYDARGLLSQESAPGPCCGTPSYWVSHTYDTLGRRVASERPASQANPMPITTRWRHDGLAVTETDPLGRETTRRFDALGRVLQAVDPAGSRVDYEYDAFDNLVTVRDSTGAMTSITYDVRGFRRSIDDASAGRWLFDYSPLGELRSQTSPRGQATTYTYDRLSRTKTRTEPEGTTTWTWGNSASSRNIGVLSSVSGPGFQESYQFDGLGRPTVSTTTIGGAVLVTRQSYDPATGLLDVLTYPASTGSTPLRIRSHYSRGALVRMSDADTGITYWQLDAIDDTGQVTDETLGNGVRVSSTYDALTGRLVARLAGPGGGSVHQNLGYAWDAAGNLAMRDERNLGVQEHFAYDARDRLDYVSRNGSVALDLAYDDAGNITFKSDVGSYSYDPSRRQRVTAAGANTYAYDASGAVVNASGTAISWLSFGLPSQLTHPGGNYSAFYYGPDRARYRQVARAGGVLTDTLYAAGGLYERVTTGSATSHRHYIVANGRRVAVHTRSTSAAPSTVYLLEDHLGGVDGVTSASGALLMRASYHPYGARRSGDWLGAAPTSGEWQSIRSTTPRGYTDHEHVDNLGIIHMNGRVYDPVLGRFLSPDPVVQAPYDGQSLNRYAYVRNNPLRYWDPTGFNCVGQASTDGECLEEVIVQGSSLPGWQSDLLFVLSRAADWFSQSSTSTNRIASAPGISSVTPDNSIPPPPPIEGPVPVATTVTASSLPSAAGLGAAPALAWSRAVRTRVLSSRSLLLLGAGGALASILASPSEISETSDLLDENGEPLYVYHFTNNDGKRGISATGVLMPGASGRVYFSAMPYANADQAQSALALPREPSGYFAVPRSNVSGPLTWTVVGPNFGQRGGGMEASVRGVVPLTGSQWVSFGQ